MDGIWTLALAGTIASALLGTLYAAADAERDDAAPLSAVSVEPLPSDAMFVPEPIPGGHDVPLEALAMLDAEPGELVDPSTGVRMGPLTVLPRPAPVEPSPPPAARRTPSRPPTPVYPRLSSDPGMNVILIARRMMAQNDVIQGSCYRYLSEVFARAGHTGWRTRRTVFQGQRQGPYADLGQIRAGDWLYIVNHPERTPVGTHSVLFVSWEDRAQGYARVIEHSGWGSPSAGQERGYDVSRTYRIIRPTR